MRIHVVVDGGPGPVERDAYLGCRVTDDPDPAALLNIGHVIALIRASGRHLGPGQCVWAYLEGHGHRRWSLPPGLAESGSGTPGRDLIHDGHPAQAVDPRFRRA